MEPTPLHLEELRGLELADAPVSGQRRGHISKREVGVDPFGRPVASDAVLVEQRVNFRREGDAAVGKQRVIQAAETDVVARQHEPAGLGVPHRAGKGTPQPRDALRTPLLIGVRDQLAVGRALKPVAARCRAAREYRRRS